MGDVAGRRWGLGWMIGLIWYYMEFYLAARERIICQRKRGLDLIFYFVEGVKPGQSNLPNGTKLDIGIDGVTSFRRR